MLGKVIIPKFYCSHLFMSSDSFILNDRLGPNPKMCKLALPIGNS